MNLTHAAALSAVLVGTAHADLEVHTNSEFNFTFQYLNDIFGLPTGTSLNITLDAASQTAQDTWPLDENCFAIWSDSPSTSSGWGENYFIDDGDAKVTRGDETQEVTNGIYKGYYSPVRTFDVGESIGPGSFDGMLGRDLLTYSWTGPFNYSPIDGRGYVGIKLVIDGQTHYGWVLMVDDYPAGAKYQPIAWAYETEPGVPALIVDPFESDCPADVNGDGVVSPADFTAWINAFNNNEPGCDQNGDSACTPTDFTAWVNNFNSGC